MSEKKEFVVRMPEITGTSSIDHKVRVRMGLNCGEYVFLNYLDERIKEHKEYDFMKAYKATGLNKTIQDYYIENLTRKGFIKDAFSTPPVLTDKWNLAFDDTAVEFDTFWKDESGSVAWTGSKKKAFELFSYWRKKGISLEYLMDQRQWYFLLLKCQRENGFNRQKMMCTVFLSKDSERFNESWKLQYENELKRYKERTSPKPQAEDMPLTNKSVMDILGKKVNR